MKFQLRFRPTKVMKVTNSNQPKKPWYERGRQRWLNFFESTRVVSFYKLLLSVEMNVRHECLHVFTSLYELFDHLCGDPKTLKVEKMSKMLKPVLKVNF